MPGEGWKAYTDAVPENPKPSEAGSKRLIESAFLNALNATNLIVLTGTGSSYAAKNSEDRPSPAGMDEVWTAVKDKVGAKLFDRICAGFSR